MKNRKHFELIQALLVNVPGFPGILILVPLGEKQNTKKKKNDYTHNLLMQLATQNNLSLNLCSENNYIFTAKKLFIL